VERGNLVLEELTIDNTEASLVSKENTEKSDTGLVSSPELLQLHPNSSKEDIYGNIVLRHSKVEAIFDFVDHLKLNFQEGSLVRLIRSIWSFW
jgi:hypothetical protein